MMYTFWHRDHLTEQDLITAYRTIEQDEALCRTLWYDGMPAGPHTWLKRAKDWWVVQGRTEDGEPVGMFWLNGFQGRTAQMHFCVYSAYHAQAVEIGRAALDWLGELGWLSSVYGVTPVTHRHVIPYITALGFSIIGRLPGACYIQRKDKYVDANISVYDFGRTDE